MRIVNWKSNSKITRNHFFSSIGEILDLTDQENNPSVLEHEARGTNIGENV